MGKDETFYVIWRKGGGFFSIISSVLSRIQEAELLGFIPVVNMQDYPSTYSENHQVNATNNAWEYYFQPLSGINLNEIPKSQQVICDGAHPLGATTNISQDPNLFEIWQKYIKLNVETTNYLTRTKQQLGVNLSSCLGVHFRGQEMRTAPGHPFPPTLRQIDRAIVAALDQNDFSEIFVVTEAEQYLEYFKRRYGRRIIHTNSYRGKYQNAYEIYPRENHRYLLGLEILSDTLCLSECGGLVGGDSNVTEAARLLNQGKFEIDKYIDNGLNKSNKLVSSWLWYARASLPASLGGFNS